MTFLRRDKLDILEQPGSPVIDTLSEVFFSRHYFIYFNYSSRIEMVWIKRKKLCQ